MASDQIRTYERNHSVVYLKTTEAFGGLSNMSGGFPLEVNGIKIRTSEALYQACRFPYHADVQKLIIDQTSPMTAKMKNKPFRQDCSRPDWNQVRTKIMRWCLHVKLAQNWHSFSKLLIDTGELPIVEISNKDDFWGAKPIDTKMLVGKNILGRLLMELREDIKLHGQKNFLTVEPLVIQDFLLYNSSIETVITHSINKSISVKQHTKPNQQPLQLSLL